MKLTVLGLSITSSWGNGHATTYRGLVRELAARGHDVTFLERDVPWYRENRDLPAPPYGRTELYGSLEELRDRFAADVREADCVVVGSYVPDGVAVADWVGETARGATAFYDIDTPVTLARLERGGSDYLAPRQVRDFSVYLSFSGGPTLARLEREFGARRAVALYCSFDPELYYPDEREPRWDLGYMGTYSVDRQGPLERLMLSAARACPEARMVVAGPQYPDDVEWPPNVERIEHLPPDEHRDFYTAQRFTLNVTRADMVRAGYSPSVRLFEAAACATPVVSDAWAGLDELFAVGREILVSSGAAETLSYVRELPERERRAVGERARRRALAEHTAAHRAEQLEGYIVEALATRGRGRVNANVL